MPEEFAIQDRVAVPEPARPFGVSVPHEMPMGTASVIEMVPLNPFTAWTVTVLVVAVPATAMGEIAKIVKSSNLKVRVVLCDNDPLAPIIVRV